MLNHEYSYIDIKKEFVNNKFCENIYCFYWEDGIRKYNVFENKDYYIYISPEDLNKTNIKIRYEILPGEYRTITGERCVKIVPINKLRSEEFKIFREQFSKTYESDIKAIDRWICKNNPKYSKTVRKIYIDIETIKNKNNQYANVEEADAPIVLITCYDNFENKYDVFAYKNTEYKQDNVKINIAENENKMLDSFLNYIKEKNPDYILGWNIESYDIPYILTRLKNLDIKQDRISCLRRLYYFKSEQISSHKFSSYYIDIGGLGIFDLMAASQRLWLGKYCGYSLQKMSKYHLKEEKYNIGNIDKAYEADFDNLIKYNIIDVELCVKLDNKLKLFESFQAFQDIISINVESTLIQSHNINYYLIQKTDRVLLNSNKKTEVKTFQGGFVFESKKGIYENCYKYDFVSMYPSIIISYNISPDTILDEYQEGCINMDNKFFFKCEEGIITTIVKELYNERAKQKQLKNKNLILAYKLLMNSIYGQFTAPYGRFFSFDCGQAITYQARRLIIPIINSIEDMKKNSIIMGDTDSFCYYNKCNINTNVLLEKASNIINDIYKKDGIIKNQIISLEMEKSIDKMIIFGSDNRSIKKKYIEFSNNEIKMIGLDAIKSDTQEIARELQIELVNLIIYSKDLNKKMLDEIVNKYELKFKEAIENRNYEYIALPTRISKDYEKYKNNPFALRAIQNSEFKPSMNERFLVLMLKQNFPICFKFNEDLIEIDNNRVDKNFLWKRVMLKTKIFYDLLLSEQLCLNQYMKENEHT